MYKLKNMNISGLISKFSLRCRKIVSKIKINSISNNCCDVVLSLIKLKVKNGRRKKDKKSLIVVFARFSDVITTFDFNLLLVAIRILTNANNIISMSNEAKNINKNIFTFLSIFLIINKRNKGN